MASERLSFADALGAFAPGQPLRAALILTYSFDGCWFEEAVAPELFERPVTTALVLRDRRALLAEAPSVRYHRADAAYSTRVFHPKLALFVAEDRALAVIGSANMTRGGFERNLELASAFDVSTEGGSRSLFDGLLTYLSDPLRGEVAGGGLHALDEVVLALREVLDQTAAAQETAPHTLLHNYERCLWDQLLEQLPHRTLKHAAIISPFYEPDAAGRCTDDPPGQTADNSVFHRLFSDFEFEEDSGAAPVSVYIQEDDGLTALPVEKLRPWKQRLSLNHRLATSQDARLLHGKLLVLEGTGRKGKEAFLVALSGSPNFTSAALLTTPPDGNAELAVLTRLPSRGTGAARVVGALGLAELFGPVADWEWLRSKVTASPPAQNQAAFMLTDVTFQMVGRVMALALKNLPPAASRFRLSALVEGAWTLLAEGDCTGGDTLTVPVPDLVTTDSKTGIVSLRAARIRLEILAADGNVLATDAAPLNVDCPQQFCGLALVGPLLLTLDQRIAQAGTGAPLTYREQQKWLERLRQQQGAEGASAPTHQADLDRFFRNLHAGLRGLRRRLAASPRSEFTLRNTLRQLSGWCAEAVDPEGKVATAECRAFLLDRLAEEMFAALDRAKENVAVAARLSTRGMTDV